MSEAPTPSPNPNPNPNPNAPLEAFQRRLDADEVFFDGPGSCHQSTMGNDPACAGSYRLGHLPSLDETEGSSDE